MKKLLHICAILAVLLPVAAGCNRSRWFTADGGVWNTTYHIVYNSPVNLDDSIRATMRLVAASLSPFDSASTVSRINRGESLATDSLYRLIFTASQDVSRRSWGAFDPTVAPLVNAWGFGYRNGTGEPSQAAIDSLLPMVGILSCRLDGDSVIKKHPLTEFNFSAITKGFGCDMVAGMLRRNGVTDYMVEIGGEIALAGHNPGRQSWRIMVDVPDTAVTHSRLTVITPPDGGIATSGNYRNFRETGHGRVWHTINPVTGRPAPSRLLSATVTGPSAMICDALATSCMAMQPDSAMAMIEDFPGAEALFVLPDMSLRTSTGFPELQ